MLQPAAITLNGVPYKLYEEPDVNSWVEVAEPAEINDPEVVGSSRPMRSARPDIRTWIMDDWSGGEGQEHLDTSKDHSFRKYHYNSTGSVDVFTPGAISMGLQAASFAVPTTRKYGPYLAFSRNIVDFFVDDRLFVQGPIGTWTDKGVVAAAAGNTISGPVEAHGGYLYVTYKDGTAAAASSRVRRIIWDGTTLTQVTQQVSANMEQALVTDNRLFVTHDATGKLLLRESALPVAVPAAVTDKYTMDGVGSEAGLAGLGPRVFIATQYVGEEPRIHIWESALQQGAERVKLPVGMRMDTTPYVGLIVVGDIMFAGGYREGTAGFPSCPMLAYVAGGRSGTIGLIRSDLVASAHRILAMASGYSNRVMMGTDQGHVYAYDIAQGGISQYIAGITAGHDITSILYAAGRFYIGSRAGASGSAQNTFIWTTTPTGAGKHPTATKVHSSIWDFGTDARKIITELEVVTEPLPIGCVVDVEIVLENGIVITTDVNGALMRHSGEGANQTIFRVSGLSSTGALVTRSSRTAQVNWTFRNAVDAGDPGDNTATVRQIVTRALVADVDELFYEISVSLEDETSTNRVLGQQISGEQQANNLRDIRDATPKAVVKLVPFYETGSENFPKQEVTPLPVLISGVTINLTRTANGWARFRARVLSRRI